MVFNRRHDPRPAEPVAQPLRRAERPAAADVHVRDPRMPQEQALSVIGSDLSIEGETITIRCKGSLKVHGNISADVHSRELEVGRQAVIRGSIAADTVDVFGRVEGAILGAKVVLHATAQVDGDIHSQNLAVELGATFDGRSRHVQDAREVAPQLERADAPALGAAGDGAGYGRHPQPALAAGPAQSAQPGTPTATPPFGATNPLN